MLHWAEAKKRRSSLKMIKAEIAMRTLVHGFPQEVIDNLKFNLCKGYTCGAVIWDVTYTWCADCRAKFQKRT